jgi:hypothetical protein
MKTAEKLVKTNRNSDRLISRLTGVEILDLNAMMYVRGGGGDGGGTTIIITPPPDPH